MGQAIHPLAAAAMARRAAQAPAAPRGNGSDIVLSDVYSSETDLNTDLWYGVPAGTTARQNAEREARYAAEREAERLNPKPAYDPYAGMSEAQKRKAEAKAKADNDRYWKREERAQAKRDAKRDANAYAMGANAGAQISLNRQVAA